MGCARQRSSHPAPGMQLARIGPPCRARATRKLARILSIFQSEFQPTSHLQDASAAPPSCPPALGATNAHIHRMRLSQIRAYAHSGGQMNENFTDTLCGKRRAPAYAFTCSFASLCPRVRAREEVVEVAIGASGSRRKDTVERATIRRVCILSNVHSTAA